MDVWMGLWSCISIKRHKTHLLHLNLPIITIIILSKYSLAQNSLDTSAEIILYENGQFVDYFILISPFPLWNKWAIRCGPEVCSIVAAVTRLPCHLILFIINVVLALIFSTHTKTVLFNTSFSNSLSTLYSLTCEHQLTQDTWMEAISGRGWWMFKTC